MICHNHFQQVSHSFLATTLITKVLVYGLGAPHWMGMISMTTPTSTVSDGKFSQLPISRLQRVTVDRLKRNKGVPIITYSALEIAALSTLNLKPIQDLQHLLPVSTSTLNLNLGLVWHCGFFFKKTLVLDPVGLDSCRM